MSTPDPFEALERDSGPGSSHASMRRLIRSALGQLHDPASLQRHPLARMLAATQPAGVALNPVALRELLHQAIVALRPSPATPENARAWRVYRVAVLRYLEGRSVATVGQELGVSTAEFYRLLGDALNLVEIELHRRLPGIVDFSSHEPLATRRPLSESALGCSFPNFLTSFVGRQPEIAAVRRLLERGRLVTLVGPPGVGKTRLGLAVATGLLGDYPDGVWFVSLASADRPNLALAAIAAVVCPGMGGNRPLTDVLIDALRVRETLLVLDNFEQIVGGATHVAQLLAACPGVRILATSRVPLRIYGEHTFPVPPLPLPTPSEIADPGRLEHCDAVHLFVERARMVAPDFALTARNAPIVAAICQRLDGLPLAIELAAARSRFFPPEALLVRLNQATGGMFQFLAEGPAHLRYRHQTLDQAVAWSYELLDEGQRRLFRRLGAFVGGFTVDTVAAVLAAIGADPTDLAPNALHRDLIRLVESSMVNDEARPDGGARFALLETVREFALGRLATSGESDCVHDAHAAHFLGLARRAASEIHGPSQLEWIKTLQVEQDNLRKAHRWLIERGRAGDACQLASGLHWFRYLCGYWTEARAAFEQALAVDGPVAGPVKAEALVRFGHILWRLADYDRASTVLAEAKVCGAEADFPEAVGFSNAIAAGIAISQGNFGQALPLIESALIVLRSRNETTFGAWGQAAVTHGFGEAMMYEGELAFAEQLLIDADTQYRQLGDRFGIVGVLRDLGHLNLYLDNAARARGYLAESLALATELGDRWNPTHLWHYLALVALRQGDPAQCQAIEQDCVAHARRAGDREALANSLEGLGLASEAAGQFERAAKLLGAMDALRAAIHFPIPPVRRPTFDATQNRLAARLGGKAFTAAWQTGCSMSLDDAVTLALEETPRPLRREHARRDARLRVRHTRRAGS